MKFSNIIAKQIRMKHLSQGIKHTQIRNKYRNQKLKQHYRIPSSHPDRFYLYSNIQGNQFVFKKQHFDAVRMTDPANAYPLIEQFQKKINQQIYQLWQKNKSYAKNEYFSFNKKLLIFSILGTWILSLLLCIGLRIINMSGQIEANIQWFLICAIILMIVINSVIYVQTNSTKYIAFQYDNEIVKLAAKKLIDYQQRFKVKGLQVKCDREITWICFKISDQRCSKELHSSNIIQLIDSNLGSKSQPLKIQ